MAINTDASLPNASAILDVKSTSKGFLVPRLTSAQRTVIGTPADGLWVYDTDTKSFWYFKSGTGWQEISGNAVLSLPYAASVNFGSFLLSLTNNGTGGAFSGTAGAGGFGVYGLANSVSGAGVLGDNAAGGEAVTGRTKSVLGTPTGAVVGRNDGPGFGVYGFVATDVTGTGIGVLGRAGISGSTGIAGHFENLNATNAATTLEAVTNGTGIGASISNTNSANVSNIFQVATTGPGVIADHSKGNAGNFFMNNTSGVGAGVRGEVNSIFGNNGTAGVYGVSSGTGGYGGYFEHTNGTGFGLALLATSAGQGRVADFETTLSTNGQPTVTANTVGTGGAATFSSNNTASTVNTVNVSANGPGVIADHSQGNAGNFFMNNTSGVGAGVRGEVNSIFGNNGTAGVYGVSSGTGGYGGYFEHSNASGFGITLYAISAGQGTVLVANQAGSSGDIAIFQTASSRVARIDRTGKGFFNGGTQNSGADLAEAFDVKGKVNAYEPGDVLAISVDADRTVQKSQEAYSSLVVGVYATKPGVLLTEESADSKLDDKVPMGVVGVIPTKVCNENGPIHRGDILVSASLPGYAMKADLNLLKPGQAIGKALQEFDGQSGKIKVLVNVR